ncbi:MAG: pyridoxal-dependent decarboxylase [Bacteroidetes bacterium HGW-Bacteroidetes-9]|jgi:L-2,4-diaminobutyrate decarboxylase|nr:MAG: pyridoxal-dependent decarboxylase [Bacteroidetes bacterium HGW-Bacteroidetes-9]
MTQLLEHAFDPEEFRREGHKLVDLLSNYLQKCRKAEPMQVLPPSEPDDLVDFWTNDLKSKEFNLQDFYNTLIDQSNHIHHPRYMGHQVVPPAPVSALTEMLEALLNNGMAIYEMGPAATAIERVVIRWLARHVGLPENADGLLTSGGSAGNLTCLLAARQAMCGYNIWEEGTQADNSLAFLVSEEAHYSVSRAAHIMGWGDKGVVKVPVNSRMQLDTSKLKDTLEKARADGLNVIALVGNACSTSTGTYDPINEMADFAEANGLWFHVDGAHGGAAVMTEKYNHLTKGIERADSLVIDFHKMMLTPALTTAVLFKNGQHSFETFAQKAEYLLSNNTIKPWYDGAGRSLECTKKMLGVKVYTMIRFYGDQLFSDYITTTYDLGQTLAGMILGEKGFELAVKPDGNIVCFRYRPESYIGDINQLTTSIRKNLLDDASFYVVQTTVRNEVYLRVSLMNPFTTHDDLETLITLIKSITHNIHAMTQ